MSSAIVDGIIEISTISINKNKAYYSTGEILKTIIQVHEEGKYFVAVDLATNVADQGLTEEKAISNLRKGLEEHYEILMELSPKGRKISFLDIEVEKYAKASNLVS
jgi:predicted RNase H-like HicB family nuclease